MAQRGVVSALVGTSFLCAALLFCPPSVRASINIRNKIISHDELSLARRAELVRSLRVITGWPDLAFDRHGELAFGTAAHRGSQSARDLLVQAQSGSNIIIIEEANNRQDVVFSRVVRARWKNHASEKPAVFVLLIDFSDFDHLIGDREALKAFDAGWAFLHEINHVVNDSQDPTTPNGAGECEHHINMMRRECDLPLRADYFFTFLPYAQQSDFKTKLVRLAFDWQDSAKSKRRRYWIIWDAARVGGLARQEVAASR